MELKDLLPEQPEFAVQKTNKTYSLRKVTVRDHAWLSQKHDKKPIKDIFREPLSIAQFVYHLMTQEQRADFMSFEGDVINDDGVKEHVKKTGPQVLLEALELEEFEAMSGALTRAMLNGTPEAAPAAEKAIKELQEEEKKRLPKKGKQTGQKSLTSSQVSTDTRSISSRT